MGDKIFGRPISVKYEEEQLGDYMFQSNNNKSQRSQNNSHSGVFTLLRFV